MGATLACPSVTDAVARARAARETDSRLPARRVHLPVAARYLHRLASLPAARPSIERFSAIVVVPLGARSRGQGTPSRRAHLESNAEGRAVVVAVPAALAGTDARRAGGATRARRRHGARRVDRCASGARRRSSASAASRSAIAAVSRGPGRVCPARRTRARAASGALDGEGATNCCQLIAVAVVPGATVDLAPRRAGPAERPRSGLSRPALRSPRCSSSC